MLIRTEDDGHPGWTYWFYAAGMVCVAVLVGSGKVETGGVIYLLFTSNVVLKSRRRSGS